MGGTQDKPRALFLGKMYGDTGVLILLLGDSCGTLNPLGIPSAVHRKRHESLFNFVSGQAGILSPGGRAEAPEAAVPRTPVTGGPSGLTGPLFLSVRSSLAEGAAFRWLLSRTCRSQGTGTYLRVPAFSPTRPCPRKSKRRGEGTPTLTERTRPGPQPDALTWPSFHAAGPVVTVTVRSAHYQARGHSRDGPATPCTWP